MVFLTTVFLRANMRARPSIFSVSFLLPLLAGCASAPSSSPTVSSVDSRSYKGPPTTAGITSGDLKTRLYIYADNARSGRATGTADNLRGAAYIARELARLGLEPAGDNGTYFQDVPLSSRTVAEDAGVTLRTRT